MMSNRFKIVMYRLGQGFQQLGFVKPLNEADYAEAERWLPTLALPLFRSMRVPEQQHALRVCRGLYASGCREEDLLAAALLHDVGKSEGRVPFWTRPTIVLGKRLCPQLLKRVAVYPDMQQSRWRRSLGYAWWHAEIGAELAAQAGLSPQAVVYIRTHHQPQGPAAALHAVDEVS
jgi:hypothetical protein